MTEETKTETGEPAAAIVKAPSAALVAAGFGDAKGQGTEGLGLEDVRPPRLSLAQSGSPQVKRGNVKLIEGLHEGDIYNDLSTENYGPGPVEMVVIKYIGTRAMEFFPLPPDGPGGIKDFVVPIARDAKGEFVDERLRWTEVDGKRTKPKATLFYEYLVFLTATQEVAALSMKNTQLKVAKTLNSLIKLPLRVDGELVLEPPAWARLFSLGTAIQTKDPYSWANFTLQPKGIAPAELRQQAAALYEKFAGKNIIVEHADEAHETSTEEVPF